jgi:hypothetical protein
MANATGKMVLLLLITGILKTRHGGSMGSP